MNKEVVVGSGSSSSSGTTTIKSDGGGGGGGGGGVAVVPRRRLQPSEKQLKQQSQQNHPQRQKSFSTQTIMAGLYDLEETLGKGHFATVKAAKHVFTGERVAVKVIDKTKLDTISQKALLKEVLCMKLVQHPNVVKLYEVIDTSSKMYLVLELGQGDLYDLILRQQGGLPEQIARVYFTQILTAVSYCHKLHVAHRDLKPENVVFFPTEQSQGGLTTASTTSITTPSPSSSSLSQQQVCPILGQVKLTDFGFSNKFCPGVNLDTSCGSLAYSAPEILLGDSYDAPAVDIWSLGVILYMLVCGRAPFQEANDSETLIMIMDVKYSIPDGLSSPLKDLIRRMLVRDPGKRARLDEIEAHEWVREGRVGDDARGRPRNTYPLIAYNSLTEAESERICGEMVKGGIIASYEQVKTSLRSNAYNHVTSTYYLLAERLLREKAVQAGESEDKDPSRNPSPTPCSSSPPMIIRRKNSHQFEDVVLPSTLPRGDGQPEVSCSSISQSSRSSSCSPSSPSSQKSSIAGLDLETGASRQRKSQSQKFVCLPVIEPDLEESEDAADRAMMRVHNRNSSPHHPHYYHHARVNRERGGGGVAEEEDNNDEKKSKKKSQQASPPLHYRRTKLNRHHHHSHSDSSDEGGGGVGSGSAVVAPPSVSIVVSDRGEEEEDDDDDDEDEHLKDGGGSSNNNCLGVGGGVIKPSPSCDNNVCGGGGGSASEEARVKKKRVMFLSWFFKRSKGKRGNNERGGGGGSGSSGANGIYKTRSCAELKSRGCGSGAGGSAAGNQDESVRECFAVCNGGGDENRRKTNKRS